MENSITKEILDLEKKFWTALRERDLDTALTLTDFPCLIAGSHGVYSVDRAQFTEMFNSDKERIRDFDFDEDKAEVRQIGPDTAIVAYNVHSTFGAEGDEKSIDAVDTSTWVKRDNRWVCAMHTETELKH